MHKRSSAGSWSMATSSDLLGGCFTAYSFSKQYCKNSLSLYQCFESGSVSLCASGIWILMRNYLYVSGSGSFHQKTKTRKTFISTVLWFLNDSLPLKTDIKLPTEVTTTSIKNLIFVCISKATDGKIRIYNRMYGSNDQDPSQNITDPEY